MRWTGQTTESSRRTTFLRSAPVLLLTAVPVLCAVDSKTTNPQHGADPSANPQNLQRKIGPDGFMSLLRWSQRSTGTQTKGNTEVQSFGFADGGCSRLDFYSKLEFFSEGTTLVWATNLL